MNKKLDKNKKIVYTIKATFSSGAAMVSTGAVRYDKRSGQDNPVKMSKLK